MRETWIVQSKLTPPSPPAGWLSRGLVPENTALPPVGTLVAGLIVKMVVGLRVSEEVEVEGLDIAEHGERAYN